MTAASIADLKTDALEAYGDWMRAERRTWPPEWEGLGKLLAAPRAGKRAAYYNQQQAAPWHASMWD